MVWNSEMLLYGRWGRVIAFRDWDRPDIRSEPVGDLNNRSYLRVNAIGSHKMK